MHKGIEPKDSYSFSSRDNYPQYLLSSFFCTTGRLQLKINISYYNTDCFLLKMYIEKVYKFGCTLLIKSTYQIIFNKCWCKTYFERLRICLLSFLATPLDAFFCSILTNLPFNIAAFTSFDIFMYLSFKIINSPNRTWTYDTLVNSQSLYLLSYWGILN